MLDDIDRKLLNHLQQDAQLTSKQLSELLNLSQSPIYERIRKLEREGYIRGYVALLDRHKVGRGMVVFCQVSLKQHAKPLLEEFQNEVATLPEVVECFHIAGSHDYILKVIVADIQAYQHFIVNKLAALANVGQAVSSFVLTEIKETTRLEL